ncbi:MAG: cell division protein FtsA [Solobacterium sp.]|nr:cell division protein FtsA [Solobacterium sp.]
MADKQIFAALEAADHEVRLVVGEFFNTRFNILKVERVACDGVSYNGVTNAEAVTAAIRKALEACRKQLGAEIKKVILAIPSFGIRRYSLKSTVDVEGIDPTVTPQDIRNAISKASQTKIDSRLALIQAVCVKYTVNGITSRRLPIGERCTSLTVDIDLLCVEKKFAYQLVRCVENAGISIMDVFLDIYAVGKEAALFEQAINHQVIILKMEREATTLGLLRQGRLTTGTIVPQGLGSLAAPLIENYGINSEEAIELVKYCARLNQEVCSSNPVHIWAYKGETRTISEQELVDCIRERVNAWLAAIEKSCIPILQAGETAVMITGEGGETEGLSELLQKRLNAETKVYIPETLGGRNAGLSAALGLFYAYQDRLPITGYTDDSLDMDAFVRAVSYRDKTADGTKEDTLTNKLKGIFLEGKK